MPQEIKVYRCTRCKRDYIIFEEADKCEKWHAVPSTTVGCRYQQDEVFPHEVVVYFTNGSERVYKLKET